MKKILLPISFVLLQVSLFAQSAIFVNTNTIRQGEALPVSISGTATNFRSGSNTAVFYRGGSPTEDLRLSNVVVASNTLMGGIIEAKPNALASFNYSCVIKNPTQPDVTLTNLIVLQSGIGNGTGKFLASVITDTLEPGAVAPTQIVIKGYNTNFKTAGTNILSIFKSGTNTPLTQFTYTATALNNNTLRVMINIGNGVSNGLYYIKVSNALDGNLELSNSLFIANRYGWRLHSVNGDNAERGQTLSVAITGIKTKFRQGSHTVAFFKQGSATSKINVNSFSPATTTFIGDTIMMANITVAPSATIGMYGVVIGNEKYVEYLQDAFEVKEGTMAQKSFIISPAAAIQGQVLQVTITGTNTNFAQASSTNQIVFMRQGSPTFAIKAEALPNTNLLMQAGLMIANNAPVGFYDVQIWNSIDGPIFRANAFKVEENNGPKLLTITPNVGDRGQTLQVSITGHKTAFTQGSQTIGFFKQGSPTNDIFVSNYVIDHDSLIRADVSIDLAADGGFYSVGMFKNNDTTGASFMYLNEAFLVNLAIGIKQELAAEEVLHVYPNPANEVLHIESKTALIQKAEIMDLQGRLVQTETPEIPSNKFDVKVGDFIAPQQYLILKVYTNKGVIFQRILIQ
ncbi:MAG: T9SS type A sorting domain-containing protein [bacterium]|nr:T9SS type A sorting domain-containing protein [bacterium]